MTSTRAMRMVWVALLAAVVALVSMTGSSPIQAEGKGAPLYSHMKHEGMGIKLTCSACHGATSTGMLTMPAKDQHKPCANQACHAADFRAKDSTLCTVCHDHNEPWRANPVRGELRKTGEFWVGFSHKSHLNRGEKSVLAGRGCPTCHTAQAGMAAPPRRAGVLAPQHELCASCHESLSEPKMTDCNGCHKLETGGRAASAEAPGAWRTGGNFAHETHRTDVRTAKEVDKAATGWKRYDAASATALDCKACHGNVLDAGAGDRLPRPTMAGCGTCHNGAFAFKTTGFECVRCHGASASAAPAAPKGSKGS